MLEEQVELIADRPMQPDLPEGSPAGLDTALELGLSVGSHVNRERRPQQGRMACRLEIRQEVPRFLVALVAEVRDPLVPVGLGADDLVGVLDTAANQAEG